MMVRGEEIRTVWSRDGKHEGRVVGVCESRRCGVESCSSPVLCVRWKNGKATYPCRGGIEERSLTTGGTKWFIM